MKVARYGVENTSMEPNRNWGTSRSTRTALIVRIGLAFAAILGSFALAYVLLSHNTGKASAAASVATTTATATTTPTGTNLPAGPTNKTWYFAEGRVGSGFREYITIQNPNTVACPVVINYFYTIDNTTTPLTKTVNVNIPAASRLTEAVHGDLGIDAATTPAAAVSTVVLAGTGCPGVVAERPIYFSGYHGILSSGTDALGVTTLNKTFRFADVPNDANNISFITILNPGTAPANITATYYSGGALAATQKLKVPGNSRGTIAPNAMGTQIPPHSAVMVTSDVNVAVERPSYFLNTNGTAGASDVIGAPTSANDWLFAEGFTGAGFQENLTIGNTDLTTAAAVVVTLKSQTGQIGTVTLSVPAQSQMVVNVNNNNTFAGATPEVSAEVKSTGAMIVVQRELYFTYHHTFTVGGNAEMLGSQGVTDVMGQVGPLTAHSYSFAEGYTNTKYNEWVTIQNPTANAETIWVTIVNELGQTYSTSIPVAANSRATLDITAAVRQFLAGQTGPAGIMGNEVSLTVQTINNGGAFLAERPEYWNTAGTTFITQGGSDILGYAGG